MKNSLTRIKIKLYKLYSLRYWEFWPASIFYLPVVFYYIFLMLKFRLSPTAISAVNPCFSFGGMAFDSKFDMISKFFHFPEFVVKTILVPDSKNREIEKITHEIKNNELYFPFICKPDKGHRGNGFKIIRNQKDFENYFVVCDRPFIIQEYADYPLEYGVFWIKIPGTETGSILSITRKVLPYLKGDGKSTLSSLIIKDNRARFMATSYFEKNSNHLDDIIPLNKMYKICSTGNHCQGAIFEDGINDIQGKTLDKLYEICSSVEGYDFGRMDIKFENQDSLSNGKGFKILEVNGSEAEFTHIYDKKYSATYAYKTLYFQWNTLFKIAKLNRLNGFQGLGAKQLVMNYLNFFLENKTIKSD